MPVADDHLVYVSHLALTNFRNYRSLEMDLPSGFILLQGDNAQGKTNFLEALYLLAVSRSPRTRREGELIAWDAPEGSPPLARLSARVRLAADEMALEIVMMGAPLLGEVGRGGPDEGEKTLPPSTSGVQRRLRVNGVPRRAIDFLGVLRVALFRPEDLELVSGPPAGRRRALDILLSQTEARYPRALQRYNRILLQRSHLLRRIAEHRASLEELTPWDESLVKEGAYLLEKRYLALSHLSKLAAEAHFPLSRSQERLAVSYLGTVAQGQEADALGGDRLADKFWERLAAARRREVTLGQTTVGPHRDDLELLVNGVAASVYGSRGQQRTIALAWKLAEARYLQQMTGEDPVVLLDDVLSELDAGRRRCVLELTGGYQQVFLTTTGVELGGEPLPVAARFSVHRGELVSLPGTSA